MSPTAAPLRSDAKANRAKLIETARKALTADPDASLNSIAKTAGVGAGTLYRHFPNREALIVAVNRAEIEQLLEIAHELLEQHAPIEAFRLWCHLLIDHVVRQQGFREVLRAALSQPEQEEAYMPVRMAIDRLLRECEAVEAIEMGIEASDVQLLLSFIWQIRTPAGERRAHRAVEIVLRGLGAR